MPHSQKPTYVWLQNAGYRWLLRMVFFSELSPLIAAVALVAGGWAGIKALIYSGGIVFILGSLILWFEHYAYHHLVRCPHCDHRPGRKKDGSKKKITRAFHTEMSKLTACPHCGK
jgi:hypothetical protein